MIPNSTQHYKGNMSDVFSRSSINPHSISPIVHSGVLIPDTVVPLQNRIILIDLFMKGTVGSGIKHKAEGTTLTEEPLH